MPEKADSTSLEQPFRCSATFSIFSNSSGSYKSQSFLHKLQEALLVDLDYNWGGADFLSGRCYLSEKFRHLASSKTLPAVAISLHISPQYNSAKYSTTQGTREPGG